MRGVRALVVGGDEGPAALRLPAGDAACTLRGAGCVQARLLPAMGRASWPGREVPLDGGTAPQGYLKAGLRPFRAGVCGSGTGTHAQRRRRCAIAGSTVSRSL